MAKKNESHLCIRIYKDDTVEITDQDGNPIKPMSNPKPIVGPERAYHHALWYNENPT